MWKHKLLEITKGMDKNPELLKLEMDRLANEENFHWIGNVLLGKNGFILFKKYEEPVYYQPMVEKQKKGKVTKDIKVSDAMFPSAVYQ